MCPQLITLVTIEYGGRIDTSYSHVGSICFRFLLGGSSSPTRNCEIQHTSVAEKTSTLIPCITCW